MTESNLDKHNHKSGTLSGKTTDKTTMAPMTDGKDAPISITLAKQEDLKHIVDIYNENVSAKNATADLQPIKEADRQSWFENHLKNPSRPIYVIKNTEADVMAWGSYNDFKSRSAYDKTSEISIYVSTDFQRRKLASILLGWMLQQAPKLDIHNVMALIFAHNQPSIRLFEKFEFEKWGKLPHVCDMEGFYADVVIMGRNI